MYENFKVSDFDQFAREVFQKSYSTALIHTVTHIETAILGIENTITQEKNHDTVSVMDNKELRKERGYMEEIVKITELVKEYHMGDNVIHAVNHTNLTIERGKFTAIVGRSGSGKSTLLQIMGGLDRPDSGKVIIDGQDLFALKKNQLAAFRRKKIGFIFQDYNLIPSLNVWENVVLTLGLDGRKGKKDEIMELLKIIGIADKCQAMPNTLSGGQKQRVAIARALVTSPSIILADEPTGNLDSKTELEVITLLKNCVKQYHQTLVMITHDETIAQMADTVVVIEDGKVVNRS